MSVSKRLEEILYCKRFNLRRLSEVCEIPYTTLRNHLGDTKHIGFDVLVKLHDNLKVNLNWLISGEGKMFSNDSDNETIGTPEINPEKNNDLSNSELLLVTLFRDLSDDEKRRLLSSAQDSWVKFKNGKK